MLRELPEEERHQGQLIGEQVEDIRDAVGVNVEQEGKQGPLMIYQPDLYVMVKEDQQLQL